MKNGTFVLTFEDERDFVRAASQLLGAAYVSGADAVDAINKMASSRRFGQIVANQCLPVPVDLTTTEQ